MAVSGVMNRKSLDAPENTISEDKNKRNRMRFIRNGAFLSVFFFTVFFGGLYLGRQRIIPFVYTRSEYMIGIYTGSSPLDLKPASGFNPVVTARMVTDVEAKFVADPFMIEENGTWYMFFEILEGTQNKGVIGLATSADGMSWEYDRVVLEQPFHLSYPHVFRHEGEILMIPESHMNYSVDVYKAESFPYHWVKQKTLLEGNYLDPTVFQYGGHWYMFAADRNDMLHLFWADELLGEWYYHPSSPIIRGDLVQARPAGRVVVSGDTVIRFAQNCEPHYGWDVRAFFVADLSPETYSEEPFSGNPVLKGTGALHEWNGVRMHHLSATRTEEGWIAVVDGVGRWREFGLGLFGQESNTALGPTIPIKSPYLKRSK
ncbi:MAG: glucosamine inositolphosphorylceramide transferase family protein [Fibrobacterota bacterium]